MSKRFEFLLLALLVGLARGQSEATVETREAEFSASLTNGMLKVGTDCSEHMPCNARFGNTVYSFKTAGTVKVSGSTSGLVFIYVDSSGNLAAGSKVNLECQACSFSPGVTQFPPDSIPLFTWNVVGGAFQTTGRSDVRAIFSTTKIVSGTGTQIAENAGTATVSVDPTLVSLHVLSSPKTSHDNCSTGQFSFDNDYYYICVAVNTWKRFALSTF